MTEEDIERGMAEAESAPPPKNKGGRPRKQLVSDDEPMVCTITLDLTEAKMDSIWARQPLTMKGYLIQMLLQDEDEVE